MSDGKKGGVTLDQARPTYRESTLQLSKIIQSNNYVLDVYTGPSFEDGLEIGAGEHYCLNRTSLITILPFYYNPP